MTTMNDRITSMTGPMSARVRIKPLVWTWHRNPKDTSVARTQIGSWTVWEINNSAYWYGPDDTCGKPCGSTLEAAKAAAQADYEARILSALDLTPAPAVEPRTVIGGDASVAVCPICDIAGCQHMRGEVPAVEPVALTAQDAALVPVNDHEPIEIGDIGNYYGGLWLKRDGGKDYWCIENYDGMCWSDCPADVATALRAIGGDA